MAYSSIPKYKFLLTYRYSEIIQDLNLEFCVKYIDKSSRTFDQRVQAARSGKQNIVEAVGESQTTKKNEIKLLGYALGSDEELLSDCEDYLRQHNLPIYSKSDLKVTHFRKYGYRLTDINNLNDSGQLIEKPNLPANPTDASNFLITLLHIQTYLLDKQIKAMIAKFENDGGFTENLFKNRLKTLK